jgi:TetR/AcrR family transcriptional regulator
MVSLTKRIGSTVPRATSTNPRGLGSKDALFAAASEEFALHGFAGASVDAIATRAGINKAMIYYHFGSKQGLYVAILRAVFASMGERTTTIVSASTAAEEKIAAFVAAISGEADARPCLPPIMMREMAEGARHLDRDTLRLMARVFFNLRQILDQGAREGVFRRVDPFFAYLSLISPIIFFRASRPVRAAMGRHNVVPGLEALDNGRFLADLTKNLLNALAPDAAPARRARGGHSRGHGRPRSGEHT